MRKRHLRDDWSSQGTVEAQDHRSLRGSPIPKPDSERHPWRGRSKGAGGGAEVSLVTGLEAALPQPSPTTHRVQSSDGNLGPAAADSAAGRR